MARNGLNGGKVGRTRIASLTYQHAIDTIDLEILQVLQSKGRATNVEIARLVGLSAPPTLRRVRALERKGIVCGYHAVLDGKMLGYGATAFLQVSLEAQKTSDVEDFESCMSAFEHVRECYALSGQTDFLLKCVFRDLSQGQDFVTNTLLHMANVSAVKSSFTIRNTKHEGGVPLSLLDVPPSLTATYPPRRKIKLWGHR